MKPNKFNGDISQSFILYLGARMGDGGLLLRALLNKGRIEINEVGTCRLLITRGAQPINITEGMKGESGMTVKEKTVHKSALKIS